MSAQHRSQAKVDSNGEGVRHGDHVHWDVTGYHSFLEHIHDIVGDDDDRIRTPCIGDETRLHVCRVARVDSISRTRAQGTHRPSQIAVATQAEVTACNSSIKLTNHP